MKFSFNILFVSCLMASSSFAMSFQKKTPKEICPRLPTVPDLDAARYTGGWYQAYGMEASFQPTGTRCIKADYGLNEDGTVSVRNSCITVNNTYSEVCGYADVPNIEYPGELEVHFPGSPGGRYWVLDTDYANFAAVYSCREFEGAKLEFGWLLTRERYPNQELIETGLEAFIKNGISIETFDVIDQSEDCIYENPDGTSCADQN